jgi:hypothetical protein
MLLREKQLPQLQRLALQQELARMKAVLRDQSSGLICGASPPER